jgi:hypothetical protein
MGEDKQLLPLLKSAMSDVLGTEDIIIDAMKEMVRDEVKRHIKKTLDANPQLRQEIKDTIALYLEAKVRQVYASVKLAKSGAKLGLLMIPDHMKKEMSKEILSIFEKEIGEILERGL